MLLCHLEELAQIVPGKRGYLRTSFFVLCFASKDCKDSTINDVIICQIMGHLT
jgi:hypothetical protein